MSSRRDNGLEKLLQREKVKEWEKVRVLGKVRNK
jgi:hypothetical protein